MPSVMLLLNRLSKHSAPLYLLNALLEAGGEELTTTHYAKHLLHISKDLILAGLATPTETGVSSLLLVPRHPYPASLLGDTARSPIMPSKTYNAVKAHIEDKTF